MNELHSLQEKAVWLLANFGDLEWTRTPRGFVIHNSRLETSDGYARATLQASGPTLAESLSAYFDKVSHPRFSHLVLRENNQDRYMTVNPRTLEIQPSARPPAYRAC